MNSRFNFIDLGRLTSTKVEQFHRYWLSKCTDDRLPSRAAIQPFDLPKLLPYLVIVDIEREGPRIRYRLVGTHVVDAHGSDFTGRYLDECKFTVEASLVECYRRLVATRQPVFASYEWNRDDMIGKRGSIGASETGFFPLSSDGVIVDGAISIADSDIWTYARDAKWPEDRDGAR